MLRTHKSISIVMTLCLCIALLAPVFAIAPVADAASDYTVLKTESVSATGTHLTNVKIQIDVKNVTALTANDIVTLHLPKGLLFDSAAPVTFNRAGAVAKMTTTGAAAVAENININAPTTADGSLNAFDNAAGNFVAYAVGTNTLDIKVGAAPVWGACTAGRLVVEFTSVLVDDTFDGDIKVNFAAPANSGFSSALGMTVAKYVSSSQGTSTIAKSVTNLGTERTNIDVIMIQESVKGALKSNEEIKLKLANGFRWQTSTTASATSVAAQWGYQGLFTVPAGAASADNAGAYYFANSNQELYIKMPANLTSATTTAAAINAASEGRLYLSNFAIEVADDNIAKKGDVLVNVSSNLGNVTDQDVPVANYVDYTTTVEATKVVEDKMAGWDETELGTIRIKEGLANSLLAGRTLSLTLPEGVKWHTNGGAGSLWPQLNGVNPYTFEGETGTLNLAGGAIPTVTSNNNRTIKITVPAHTKSSVLLKKLNVSIAPDFVGDLNVEVGGNAGATGTVKVAVIKAPVQITNDASAKIIIGSQGQAVSDIVIKENIKEAIKADSKANRGNAGAAGRNKVVLQLPEGATWTSTPKVEVTEGDLAIDTVSSDARVLTINTKSSSSKPSSIKISGIKVTTNRTVPEGDFKVKLLGSTGNLAIASTALTDNANANAFDKASVVSAVIGQCVTPAPGEGTTGAASGQFKLSSNIYQVNGVAKVMDAAPYIKNSRTYVPVRFLGYAMGLTDTDIAYDTATQKATFTKGDKKVELTVGSTTITVNGEAKTMDVAPEISGDRMMLPARYVAEGLGFQVGWDQATGTILISK